MTNIEKRHVDLPRWLDDFIFNELSATYSCKRKDLVVLEWDKTDILSYLGTYFPRSYAESYCIFSTYIRDNISNYCRQDTISIFDFGCGTGGELIGFIVAVSELLPNIRNIEIRALDGNAFALRLLEAILEKVTKITGLNISTRIMNVTIDDFYDMSIVKSVINTNYDFIITFKAICEFVTKQQFELKNPYEHFLNTFMSKLSSIGIVCITDITTYSNVSNEWLPKMLDRASVSSNLDIIASNSGFNESFYVSHSFKTNDLSKIAWRIYKTKK
ncbi:MAG: hypothetical protein LUC91_02205 [Prevotella sp.]|nr:hypothetical protein [Prevotella sp.]